ncbi:MAG: O-antigen ligase family protein [Methylococcaceae bacterium]
MRDSMAMRNTSSFSLTSLCIGFVRWIFMIYLGVLIFYGREWTVIHVGPVYTTDITLLVMWLGSFLLAGNSSRKFPFRIHLWAIFFVAFFQLLHGFLIYDNVIMTLRQFAPFLYLSFAWVLFKLYSSVDSVRRLLKFIFFCSALSVAVKIADFSPDGLLIGHYSVWGVATFIGVYLYYSANRRMEKRFVAAGLITNILGIFSVPVRGAWIALVLTLLFCGWVWVKKIQRKVSAKFIRNSVVGILVFMGIILVASMINPDFESRIASILNLGKSVTEGAGNSVAENNTKWRWLLWVDMFEAYLEKPIFGYGFGDKFMPQTIVAMGWGTGESDFMDPHNSHLHFLYMLGLIGFLVFELFFVRLVIRYIKVLRQSAISESSKMLILSMLGAVIYIFLLANFEVVFESPYMVVYMWIALGLLFSAEKSAQRELHITIHRLVRTQSMNS